MRSTYVSAFLGRRDSYQVPLALQEHGRLARFVTDGYDAGFTARMIKRCGGARLLAKRRCPGLDERSVQAGFDFEAGARLLTRVMDTSRAAVIADDWAARRGAAAANALGASVLLYEFQAELGFKLLRSPSQRRILFHFHPHPGWEHPLLLADVQKYPDFSAQVNMSIRAGMPTRYSEHTFRAWQGADHVIVASSCTRESLLHVGCPAERISVVPYGRETVEAEAPLVVEPKQGRPFLLWVGSGSYRKGLHHLCEAWEQAGQASEAELIVVARVVDPGMEPLLARPGIRWIRGLPRAELNWHYRHARAFVLPSMSEGFGQVYLEALSKGCPVIGTRNSVLPDVTAAQPYIRYVEPGAVDEIAHALGEALRTPIPDTARGAVAASVHGFTWEKFRAGVEQVLARFDQN